MHFQDAFLVFHWVLWKLTVHSWFWGIDLIPTSFCFVSCVNDSPTQHLLTRPAFFCFSLANGYFKVKDSVYRKVPFGLNWPNKWYDISQHSQLIVCLSKETKVNNCFDVSLIQCLQFHTKHSLENLSQVWILRIKKDVGPLQADISANSSWLANLSPLGQITGVPSS